MLHIASSVTDTNELAAAYLAAAPDAILATDDSGQIILVNHQAQLLFGYGPDELLGQKIEMLVPTKYNKAHLRHRSDFNDNPSSRRMGDANSRVHGRRKDGTEVPVDIALSPVSFAGQPGVMAVIRDMTDRKAAEDRLRASELAFRTAFDGAPVAMILSDADSAGDDQIVESNEAFSNLLGWTKSELYNTSLRNLTDPMVRRGSDTPNASPAAVESEHRYRHRDGHFVWGELHTADLQGPGESVQSLSHIVDITRRVEAEGERDRREQLLRALAEIRRATLHETSEDVVLGSILQNASSLLEAQHAFIAIPGNEGRLIYRAMASSISADLAGRPVSGSQQLGSVLSQGEALVFKPTQADSVFLLDTPEASRGIIVPVLASGVVEGVLVIARTADHPAFAPHEITAAASLGSEAAVTIELARARADRRRVFLVEDRERIARDLHDVVIQRLFAAGMSLNASLGDADKLTLQSANVIDELDATIDVIRETIFKLTHDDESLSAEVWRIIDRYRTLGRNNIDATVSGDLGAVPDSIGTQLVPTLNELLSNVKRHANAAKATITIQIGSALELSVNDDGDGIDHDKPHGFGIRNIRTRAERLGGDVTITPGPDGLGTSVIWSVPLSGVQPQP